MNIARKYSLHVAGGVVVDFITDTVDSTPFETRLVPLFIFSGDDGSTTLLALVPSSRPVYTEKPSRLLPFCLLPSRLLPFRLLKMCPKQCETVETSYISLLK